MLQYDSQDEALVRSRKWTVDSVGYPAAKINKRSIRLHQAILGRAPKGFHVDHINGDKLDNRRANLRFIPHDANLRNASTAKSNTGVRGITFGGALPGRRGPRYIVKARIGGASHHIGRFTDLGSAVKASHYYRLEHDPFYESSLHCREMERLVAIAVCACAEAAKKAPKLEAV